MGHRGKKESARRMIASGRLAVEEIAEYAGTMGFHVIDRKPELARNTANGNDLLVYQYECVYVCACVGVCLGVSV